MSVTTQPGTAQPSPAQPSPAQPSTAQPSAVPPAQDDFPAQTDAYRRELFAHCYRMVGSVHDAEDLVQETYLRAWRSFHAFEGRSSVRTWLYRIATNVCLTSIEGRARRPKTAPDAPLVSDDEIRWLEPVPDAMVRPDRADPAEVATGRESVRLAFVAVLQHLPARQRAVLVLRDVLMWRAAEVADALDLTVATVNSLLQRARATLAKIAPSEESVAEPTAEQRELLDRYVAAFWDKNIDALVAMFTDDAVWEMPPYVGWYAGPADIGRLIGTQCPGGRHEMRMVPTQANGQAAYGLYMSADDGVFRPFHLQVIELSGNRVSHVAAFFDTDLFPLFGLPSVLEPTGQPEPVQQPEPTEQPEPTQPAGV